MGYFTKITIPDLLLSGQAATDVTCQTKPEFFARKTGILKPLSARKTGIFSLGNTRD
jgi:hypothetical protein